MRKYLAYSLTSIFLSATAHAVPPRGPDGETIRPPQDACVFVPVDFALYPDVSLNALYRPACAANHFSLALGWNQAGTLHGVGLGLGASITLREASGLQVSGLASVVGRDFVGLQAAGLLAVIGEDTSFALQLGGLGAVTGGRFRGLMAGGLFAVSGREGTGLAAGGLFAASGERFRGIQVGGLFAATGERFKGIQAGGLFAASGERMHGVQIGGVFAAAGSFEGLQAGGVMVAAGDFHGLQVGGGAAVTGRGEGVQLAGGLAWAKRDFEGVQIAVVNLGGHVRGAQIGVVNIADRVDGTQIGVVNVADRTDAPIGAVSWMRGGPRTVEFFTSEAVLGSGVLRLGNDDVYSLLGVGGDPFASKPSWTPIAGFGVRIPIDGLAFHLDVLQHHLFFDGLYDRAVLNQLRARINIDILPWLAAAIGPTWNTFVSEDQDVDGESLPLFDFDLVARSGEILVRQWPGLCIGVAIRL